MICPTCTTKAPNPELGETCYHRCPECGVPFYGFHDEETGVEDDYRCTVCGEPWTYSWSTISNFMGCPTYAMFSEEMGRSTSSPAMKYGSGIHLGLDILQSTRDIELAVQEFRRFYEGPEWETVRTQDHGEATLRAFWQRHKDDKWFTAPGRNEVSGAISLAPNIIYTGKIDRILEENIVDYKTSAFFDRDSFIDTYDMSHQFTGYIYIGSVLTGRTIKDLNVWLIKVSKGTQRRTKAELEAGRYPGDDAYDFKPCPQTRRAHQIDYFVNTIIMTVKWWNMCRRQGIFPQHSTYCYHYNSKCTYLDLCQMPMSLAMDHLRKRYDLRHWDPLKGIETILKKAIQAPVIGGVE